jgi:hypothetical protein
VGSAASSSLSWSRALRAYVAQRSLR